MTQENQREKLKQLFAKRVTTQARVVLDIYQKCRSSSWSEPSRRLSLMDAAEKLDRFAERFEMPQQQQTANKIIIILTFHREEVSNYFIHK